MVDGFEGFGDIVAMVNRVLRNDAIEIIPQKFICTNLIWHEIIEKAFGLLRVQYGSWVVLVEIIGQDRALLGR